MLDRIKKRLFKSAIFIARFTGEGGDENKRENDDVSLRLFSIRVHTLREFTRSTSTRRKSGSERQKCFAISSIVFVTILLIKLLEIMTVIMLKICSEQRSQRG